MKYGGMPSDAKRFMRYVASDVITAAGSRHAAITMYTGVAWGRVKK